MWKAEENLPQEYREGFEGKQKPDSSVVFAEHTLLGFLTLLDCYTWPPPGIAGESV